MYAIYAYIGVVLGVNVGIYGSPMECLGVTLKVFQPTPLAFSTRRGLASLEARVSSQDRQRCGVEALCAEVRLDAQKETLSSSVLNMLFFAGVCW